MCYKIIISWQWNKWQNNKLVNNNLCLQLHTPTYQLSHLKIFNQHEFHTVATINILDRCIESLQNMSYMEMLQAVLQ